MHALYKGGGYQFESDVVPGLKTLLRPIVNAMNSDRSRLSFVAIDFVASLASLGRAFEPLLHFLFDALLKLCTRTSKVLIARAEAAILRVIEETTLPAVLPHLREAVKDKSQTLRTAASVAALQALQTFAPRDLANKISDVEEIIKCTGRDANPAVRQTSRKIFEAYQILFPDRVDA
ncbi:hypothetical protein EXIGLDRAFT_610894 [Exidia glandulosa HHB12029]|uniref:CLASP N-terminal domain-containing protein n=1 Tax=Exidia glandulosa HHB12029 TaxID=1314781 RepID=A0A165JQR4_EXIGL|nr:hypothetical protein EXIGLDRAFT_610894 [Exidia glandulosa HHB12029]